MTHSLCRYLRKTRTTLILFAVLALATGTSRATDVIYAAPKSQTVVLPGGWGAVVPTLVSQPTNLSDFYNDGSNFSYPVIFDTGSSGMVMSNTVQSSFGVPTTGGTYQDVGIGGTETFNVTQPVNSYIAPTNLDSDTPANFTSFGTYNYQSRQDPLVEELYGFFDIVGTPVLNNYVMHVSPNSVTDLISEGGISNPAQTQLLSAMPTLPTHGVYHIPLSYQNFVDGTPSVSTSTNPVIKNVTASANGSAGYTTNWLLDTGAAVSIVTPTLAAEIGIDTNATPAFQLQVLGVGTTIVTMDGYYLDTLSIPMSNGDNLVFNSPVVFVPETDNLPSSLTGVLGMNLLDPSANNISQTDGEPTDQVASLFSDYYVNALGANPELVLVDPNSDYVPEPGTLAIIGIGCLLMVRRRREELPQNGPDGK